MHEIPWDSLGSEGTHVDQWIVHDHGYRGHWITHALTSPKTGSLPVVGVTRNLAQRRIERKKRDTKPSSGLAKLLRSPKVKVTTSTNVHVP